MSAATAIIGQFENEVENRIAFDGPSSPSFFPSKSAPSTGRPLDLVHLARQTGGDHVLETEILQLFRQQVGLCGAQLRAASGKDRKTIAHTVKGSAGAVGAFNLSQIAAQIEDAPSDPKLIAAADCEIARVCDFIAGLNR